MALSTQEYVAKHQLEAIVSRAFTIAVRDQVADPLQFIAKSLLAAELPSGQATGELAPPINRKNSSFQWKSVSASVAPPFLAASSAAFSATEAETDFH